MATTLRATGRHARDSSLAGSPSFLPPSTVTCAASHLRSEDTIILNKVLSSAFIVFLRLYG